MIRIHFFKKGWPLLLAAVLTLSTMQAQQNFGGIALYTLRDNLNSDVENTLEKVKDIGYEYVEAAGYSEGKFYGIDPGAFKALLKSKGLEPMSTHRRVVDMDETDAMVAAVKEAGFKYFVVPSPPRSLVEVDRETRTMKMKGSLDDFVEFLTELGKKCEKEDRFAPVGQGKIDFKRILDHKEESGMQHFFVEQDRVFDGMDPLEAIEISHSGLKKYGFDKNVQ